MKPKTLLKFTNKGIYCIPGDFYIDPWLPVSKALITHGHADHARWGMGTYLCHEHTVPILKSRIGADISVQGISYGQSIQIQDVKVSFHPAGHILGSAQIRMEHQGFVSVVSGDYKIQDDGLSAPFEILRCHEFLTESTFGLPIYNWKPISKQNEDLRNWVVSNQKQDKTSVFIGYSLGKAQRIMKAVEGIAPVNVHFSIGKLNQAYESVGIKLPPYEILDLREDLKPHKGEIFILPPSLVDSNLIKRIPNHAEAICSGWMQVRGARRWRSADAGFATSDHADWKGLIQTIQATQAEKVFVTHGQAHVFTKYLTEIGIQAEEVKTHFGDEEVMEDLKPEEE